MIKFITGLFGGGHGERARTSLSYLFLLVGIGYLVWYFFFKPAPKHDLPIISILERVEYLEELELVTYYSDEILELGTADQLQRTADGLEKELKKSKSDMLEGKTEVAQAKANYSEAESSLALANKSIDSLNHIVDSLRQAHDAISSRFQKVVQYLDTLGQSEIQTLFGNQVLDDYKAYKQVESENGRGRTYRRKLRDARDKLKGSTGDASGDLGGKLIAAKDYESDMKDKLDYKKLSGRADDLKDKIDDAEQDYQSQKEDYESSQVKFDALQKSLQDQYQREGAGFKKPRLLAVVPAKVSTLINLKTVKFKAASDSLYIITVDSIYVGPVDILLDEATHYNVAEGAGGSSDKEGPYQVIFEQIRMNLPRMSKEVESKALGADILGQSCVQVEHYFRKLTHGTGLAIKVETANCQPSSIIK